SRPTARCFRHFVAIAVSKPQPESRALADCRRTLRLQAVVFSCLRCRMLQSQNLRKNNGDPIHAKYVHRC
ncbi:MAG: hypothetical protein ABGX16_03280, partial [Pirellulales bacterium]